jgi:endoglucanase
MRAARNQSGKANGFRALLMCALGLLLCTSVQAGCLDQTRLRGVNLSGAEFGHERLPGVLGKDYTYPSRNDLVYFRDMQMNVIRLPFRWERIQRQIGEPLDTTELAQLRQVVDWAKALDLCVVLDLHNFGTYHGRVLGTANLPASAFIDVWLRLHQAFGNSNETAFGLMNEPAAMSVPQWMAVAQQTVLALRSAGARHLLLVGSGRWSGAHEFDKEFDGISAAKAFGNFKDPLNNFAIELHQYADADYSGTSKQCSAAERLSNIMSKVTVWAKQHKKRLFLGEFGVANSPDCLAALRTLATSMQDKDAWLGWAYWSAGPWWGNYVLSIQPHNGKEMAQATELRKFLIN